MKKSSQNIIDNAAENKLQKQMQTLVDNTLDYAIFILDTQGRVVTWNKGAERIQGYQPHEIIGKHFSCFYEKDAILKHHPEKELEMARKNDRHEEEGFRVRKDGTRFFAHVIIMALRDEKGHVVGYGKITRDVTDKEEIEKLKKEFFSVVSHELRTPLTAIRGVTKLLLSGTVGSFSESSKQLLEIADKHCDHLTFLINDILDINRLEAGKMILELTVVDINQIVQQALDMHAVYAEKFDVILSPLQPLPNTYVKVDAARLLQVLANLISNAIKFSYRNKPVTVALQRHYETVRVVVTNEGPGIRKKFQPFVFQRFAQENASTTRNLGGSGLSLSISKAIIERLGGTLDYTSIENQETRFYFDLPLYYQKQAITQALSPTTSEDRLLLCEDDESQARYMQALLQSTGLHVDIASSATHTKQLLAKNHYMALLLDLILPDQDGISLIREIRRNEKTAMLPIIVVSILAHMGRSIMSGDSILVMDWLEKPIDFQSLLQAVTRAKTQASSTHQRILHIEDDKDVQDIVKMLLQEQAEIVSIATIHKTKKILKEKTFDLVILDLLLPDGNGVELMPLFAKYQLPIIVYSNIELDPTYAKYASHTLIKSKFSGKELVKIINSIRKKGA